MNALRRITLRKESSDASDKTVNDDFSTEETLTEKNILQPICNNSGLPFDEVYRLKKELSAGIRGTIFEGYIRASRKLSYIVKCDLSYAVKCIDRYDNPVATDVSADKNGDNKISEQDKNLLREISILQQLQHNHIIKINDFFIAPDKYYVVMERIRGGDLYDRIQSKTKYKEREARQLIKNLLEAIEYCHSDTSTGGKSNSKSKNTNPSTNGNAFAATKIAHRDLKPENIMLMSYGNDVNIKIVSFKYAKFVHRPNSLLTQCGSISYSAPEILRSVPYDERVDMWSIGIIAYVLLCGYVPFNNNHAEGMDLYQKICTGTYNFDVSDWEPITYEAKDFINGLLTVDPDYRLTASQALNHPWVTRRKFTRRELRQQREEKQKQKEQRQEMKKKNIKALAVDSEKENDISSSNYVEEKNDGCTNNIDDNDDAKNVSNKTNKADGQKKFVSKMMHKVNNMKNVAIDKVIRGNDNDAREDESNKLIDESIDSEDGAFINDLI